MPVTACGGEGGRCGGDGRCRGSRRRRCGRRERCCRRCRRCPKHRVHGVNTNTVLLGGCTGIAKDVNSIIGRGVGVEMTPFLAPGPAVHIRRAIGIYVTVSRQTEMPMMVRNARADRATAATCVPV